MKKILMSMAFLFVMAAQANEEKINHNGELMNSPEREQNTEIFDSGITTDHEQEQEEEFSNDDFDPELNAIDDDLEEEAGIYHD